MKALELNPDITHVYEKEGTEEDVDSAIEEVLLEIGQDEDNAELWWRLGSLYGKKEMYREGIEAFQKAAFSGSIKKRAG